MKKLLRYRVYCLLAVMALVFTVACNKDTKPQPASAGSDDKAVVMPNDKDSLAGITKLPFGVRPKNLKDVNTYDSDFAYSLASAGEPVQQLPPIKIARYIAVDKDHNAGLCNSNPETKNIKPVRYKYRLPDYKGFEVYYMTGDMAQSQDLMEEFDIFCSASYGNIIVYNPVKQSAQVLTVYYSFYVDSQQERYFYIDSDYSIYMAGMSVSEGEEGADEPSPGRVYRAVINDSGEFLISTLFDPWK